jgi:hypothetical protein
MSVQPVRSALECESTGPGQACTDLTNRESKAYYRITELMAIQLEDYLTSHQSSRSSYAIQSLTHSFFPKAI